MKSIVFFANKNEWMPEKWIALANGYKSDNGQFVVETSNSWISIYKYDGVFDDYDEDEIFFIGKLIHDSTPYLIEWRGDELLETFIDEFPSNSIAVIDNDHGLICDISELKGKSVNDWIDIKG